MTASSTSSRSNISTAELTEALECELSGRSGEPRRVVHLTRRPSRYATSATIEDIDAHLDDGRSLRLILKDMSRDALLETARRTKPTFLYDPRREIEVYRKILAKADLGTAIRYGSAADPRRRRYWLLLEKVPGLELYQVGELELWQEVARRLAEMHDRLARHVDDRSGPSAARLLLHDRDFYLLWLRRAERFVGEAGASQRSRSALAWLASRYGAIVDRLLDLPVSVIHGEFYASNVLVERRPSGIRVCPVDWEMAAVGPGLVDLAALTSGKWEEADRAAVALTYRAGLTRRDSWPPEPEAFLAAVDHCRLHLCLQWLGWSAGWSPPAEHAQDWLAEALVLAERLCA